jgi:hypothetical protein
MGADVRQEASPRSGLSDWDDAAAASLLADFEALGQDRDDTDGPSPFALALAEWDKATLAHAAFCKQDKANRAAWLDANPCPFVMLNYPEARGAMDYARDARTIFNGPWLKISSDLVELARSDLPPLGVAPRPHVLDKRTLRANVCRWRAHHKRRAWRS